MTTENQEGLIAELCAELCISIQTAIERSGVEGLFIDRGQQVWRAPRTLGELGTGDASDVIDWMLAEKRKR